MLTARITVQLWLLVCVISARADSFNPQTDLARLVVGTQAGLLRVLSPDRAAQLYDKGLDEPASAPWSDESRHQLYTALELDPRALDRVSRYLMQNYTRLPHPQVIALLGAIFSGSELSPAVRPQVELFLVTAMNSDRQVEARRQALLALAVAPRLSDFAMDRVVGKFERCDNLWELFPIQQFFLYQRAQLRQRAIYPGLRQRLGKVDSLYTAAILEVLDADE